MATLRQRLGTAPARLAAFAVVLATAFAGGYGIGWAVDGGTTDEPPVTTSVPAPSHDVHGD